MQIEMETALGPRCLDSRQFTPNGIPVEAMPCHRLKGAQVSSFS